MDNLATANRQTILVAAGGTGGHVFPALAVAQGLRECDLNVVWLGTRRGIESRVVPENNFLIHFINVAGVRGKGIFERLRAVLLLLLAIIQVIGLIIKLKPACVLGMGGFASAAAGIAAWLTRTPLVLQEQNAIAGTTNKLLARFAVRVFTGFPQVFSEHKGHRYSGNPLRAEFYALATPAQRLAERSPEQKGELRVLVLGGSLGAHALNDVVPQALAKMCCEPQTEMLRVVHQTGEQDIAAVKEAYRDASIAADVQAFIADMASAYADADLVIARAGALTVTELTAVGAAAVLVPYPHATDNHQSLNADWLVSQGAALKVEQSQFTVDRAYEILGSILGDRQRLLAQAEKARACATPDATMQIVNACREFAHA